LAVSLRKGQKVDLTKTNKGLQNIMVGLGWDPIEPKKGFWSNLFSSGNQEIDCDASVLLLDSVGKLRQLEHVVYYDQLKSPCGSVRHQGDNITGDGEGDDEQISIALNQIPQNIHRLVFIVNIYDGQKRKQDFGLIQNAFIRVVNPESNQELLRFNLTENYAGKTALIVGEVFRQDNEWHFEAIGQGTNDAMLINVVRRYQE